MRFVLVKTCLSEVIGVTQLLKTAHDLLGSGLQGQGGSPNFEPVSLLFTLGKYPLLSSDWHELF